jgi:hypothetical protein
MASNEMNGWAGIPLEKLPTKAAQRAFKWEPFVPSPEWPHWRYSGDRRESEQDYRWRAERWWKTALDDYIASHKRLRSEVPAQRKGKASMEQRYEWAALRVCLRWPYQKIADTFPGGYITGQAVRDQVNNICRRLGFTRQAF